MTSPNPSEPRTGHQLYHAPAFTPAEAWWLLAVGIGVIYGVQAVLGQVLIGIAAAAIADVVCIAFLVGFARRRGVGLRGLGVTRPEGRWVVAATLIGVSAWYVNMVIVSLLNVPEGPEKLLKGLLEETGLVPTIAAIALLPAIAEEILFRGVLARSLATHWKPAVAIALSSAVFGIYHVLPPQVVATFLLGCLLALLTLRSRSILPSMIAHLLNNTIAIVISREEVPGVTSFLQAHPYGTFVTACAVVTSGALIAVKGPA